MTETQKEFISTIAADEIESYFYRIDFAFRRLNAYDIDEAKVYLKQIIFHGNISNTDIANYYVEMHGLYEYYIDLEDSFELYKYIDHVALQEKVEQYGDTELGEFIDYETLGEDMFKYDNFVEAYYRFEGNVFEITVEDIRQHIDVDVAEYFYLSMKQFIDDGYHISTAAKEVAKGVSLGEAA